MAVGFPTKANWSAGDVLTAAQMDDLAGTLNTVSAPLYNAAGKNSIINGAMYWSQRGQTFTNPAADIYTLDRWRIYYDGTGATRTVSQQAFTPGTAPVAGYEGSYFLRYATTAAGTGNTGNIIGTRLENVQTLAGQTATISFWIKSSNLTAISSLAINQNFGSGGSSTVNQTVTLSTTTISASWTRLTGTLTMASLAGKTIGASSYLDIVLTWAGGIGTIDTWGWQLEAGSTATGFQTATGTLQGELAAAMRYFQKSYPQGTAPATNSIIGGIASAPASSNITASGYVGNVRYPVVMRTSPTVTIYSYTSSTAGAISNGAGSDQAASSGYAGLNNDSGFTVQNGSGTTITTSYNLFMWHYTASAEL